MKKTSKTKIITTYALALYQAAEEKGVIKKVLKDIDSLARIFSEDDQIITTFSNRIWTSSSKKDAISKIAKKLDLSDELKSCLEIMVDNNRMKEFPNVLNEFKHIYYQKHNIEEIEVLTVQALTSTQDKKLKTLLEKKLSKEVLINYTIKPEILGGLIIKYGSSMIDDSIARKLTRLEMIMKGGQ